MLRKEITERPHQVGIEPTNRGTNRGTNRLSAMSRILLFILPALFAAAAAMLWEPASGLLGGLQQPLQGQDLTYTKGFPNLKLNDGRYIPVVSTLPALAFEDNQIPQTDSVHRLPMASALPTAREAAKVLTRVSST